MRGFGRFNYLLRGTGSSRKDPLVVTIAGIAGDTLASYFKLATASAGEGNAAFAAHPADFVSSECLNSAGAATARYESAFIGDGAEHATAPVPLPAAAWLPRSGLLMLGAMGRQRRLRS